jgi:cell division protein FtsL
MSVVPLSLSRSVSTSVAARHWHTALASVRLANISGAHRAEGRGAVAWLAVWVACGVGIAFGHVCLRLQVTALGYQLSAARQVIEKLEQESHELTLEVARLEAPVRLEEMARVRLRMAPPARGQEAILP